MHCRWDWAYDVANNIVEHRTAEGVDYYMPVGDGQTRAQRIYTKMALYDNARALAGAPCSVKTLDGSSVQFLSFGPLLAISPAKTDNFLSFLKEWGDSWMWCNLYNKGRNLKWVVDAMKNDVSIWVTDGSYNREIVPKVSSAGWMVYCTR